ncbi:MAG: ABC transporter permease [Desulfatirhabdiaceae bacterium]
MNRGPQNAPLIWIAIPLVLLAVFYGYPMAAILKTSFQMDGNGGLDQVFHILSSRMFGYALGFSLFQAVLSTLLTLGFALPGVIMFLLCDFSGKKWMQLLASLPFVLPTVVVATAFRALWGSHGMVNSFAVHCLGFHSAPFNLDYGLPAVLMAHVFYNTSVVFKMVAGFGANLDRSLIDSARSLGASTRIIVFRILLPLLKPAVTAASLLVFLFCFCSFGVVLILGGPGFSTLEIEIYRQTVHFFNLPAAAILSLVQILFTGIVFVVYLKLQKHHPAAPFNTGGAGLSLPVRSRMKRLGIRFFQSAWILFFGLPLLSLVIGSIYTDTGFSPVFFMELFRNPDQSVFYISPFRAIAHSIGFAGTATLISMMIGIPVAAYLSSTSGRIRPVIDILFMLPLSTSAVTLGFGFIIAFDRPPLDLRESWILIPMSHALVAFPFVVRVLVPAFQGVSERLGEAAALLGATTGQIWWKIIFPIARNSIAGATIFSFMISLGEFGATAFIARPQTSTIPVAIFRFLSQPGSLNQGQAMAMSCLLLLITVFGFLWVEWLIAVEPKRACV